ncbi:flavodoxin family protein [bacterium]|nr:flavodoxin family protein [bacterium]
MKKVIVINGSPRKNFNTAKLLKEAQKGAEVAGAQVEYFNLYDLNFKGCVSCLACKRKGSKTNCLCAYKDEATPILEKCINADAVIIGSPVYFSYPTGEFRSFIERLMYPVHTYMVDKEHGGLKSLRTRTIPIGVIMTMNCPKAMADDCNYPVILDENEKLLKHIFGYSETLYAYDTYQFADFSKYDCDLFDEKQKAQVREKQFPIDMQKAFDMGKRLTEMEK